MGLQGANSVDTPSEELKQWEEVKQNTLNAEQNGDMSVEEELVLKQAHEAMSTKVADLEAAATKRRCQSRRVEQARGHAHHGWWGGSWSP